MSNGSQFHNNLLIHVFQPNVNGVSSEDTVVGWGTPGGYVYQKAYLEFFTSKENVAALREILPTFKSVNYNIINMKVGKISLNHPCRGLANYYSLVFYALFEMSDHRFMYSMIFFGSDIPSKFSLLINYQIFY